MRKIGEQWVETLKDGTRHMFKLVEEYGFGYRWVYRETGNGVEANLDVGSSCSNSDPKVISFKDLGILNEDGCLPCPFCGEYPVVENAYEGCGYTPPDGYWRVYCSNDNHEISISSGKRRQESIDAWNKRA